MFNPKVLNYLSEKVFEDLRKKQKIPANLYFEFNKYPIIDNFRKKVKKNDLDLILALLESKAKEELYFGLSISKNLINEQQIKKRIFEIWENSSDYKTKREVMWRILDIPDLPIKIHKEIYEFVKTNWDDWTKDTLAFYGNEDHILEAVIKRSSDRSFPESKHWVYLCLATLSKNRGAAKNFIKKYIESNITINSLVANEMLVNLDARYK